MTSHDFKTDEKHKSIGYAAAIMATIIMGSMGIFVRNISSNSYIITFSRLAFGLIFLLSFLILKNETKNLKIKFSYSLLLTGILVALVILCYTNAINSTSLANAVFLLYLAPLLAVGLASVFLGEKLTLLNGGLLLFAFFGFLFLLEFKFSFTIQESKGYLWGTGAAVCYALYIIFNRKIPADIPALTRSFYQLLFGTVVILPFLDASFLNITIKDVYWLIAIGFFQGFLALSLLTVAIKHLKTVEYSTISYIEPLVASLIGFFLYSESLTLLQSIGCAILFSAGIIQITATKNNS